DEDAAVVRLEIPKEPVGRAKVARRPLGLARPPMEVEVPEPPLRDRDRVVLEADVAPIVEQRNAGVVLVCVVVRLREEALVVLAAGLLEGVLVDLRRLVPERQLARRVAEIRGDDAAEIARPRRDTVRRRLQHQPSTSSASAVAIRSPARPSQSSG